MDTGEHEIIVPHDVGVRRSRFSRIKGKPIVLGSILGVVGGLHSWNGLKSGDTGNFFEGAGAAFAGAALAVAENLPDTDIGSERRKLRNISRILVAFILATVTSSAICDGKSEADRKEG